MRERPPLDKALDAYREQVLRWNSQINLISRKATPERLEGLILQCRNSWKRLVETETEGFSPNTRLRYFDLGSGAGLPGFIWHVQAAVGGIPIRTLLVEPREKRAWFLNRLNSLDGIPPLEVSARSWEDAAGEDPEAGAGLADATHILISLKALHLTDTMVLAGLAPFLRVGRTTADAPGGIKVLIARFYPPGQAWNEDLARDLEIPPPGEARALSEWKFQGAGGSVLLAESPRGASLVLSRYAANPA